MTIRHDARMRRTPITAIGPGGVVERDDVVAGEGPPPGLAGGPGVRGGKCCRFVVEAADEAAARAEVDDMCRRFLTNPVIEDATVTVDAGAAV